MVYIYYAYTGWNSAAYLAGEIRDAQRSLALGDPARDGGGDGTVPGAERRLCAWRCRRPTFERSWMIRRIDAGREAVAPIAQIAAARLFGPRWSTLFSIAFGMMLLSTLSAYVLIGPRVVYAMARAGQFPSIAARLTSTGGHAGRRHCASDGRRPDPALDRLIRESDHLRGRWSLDLFDARGELDLRSAVETPRAAPAVPDARISGHAGRFPARDRAARRSRRLESTRGFLSTRS